MPVTLQDVLKQLDKDEPDYAALTALGPDAVPHLANLVRSGEPGIASKAAYLASLIQTDESVDALSSAIASPHEVVRVAAAAGLRNLPAPQAARLADRLLDDRDAGVRKVALNSVGRLGLEALASKVRSMASSDAEGALRAVARQELERLGAGVEAERSPKRSTKRAAGRTRTATRAGARKKKAPAKRR
jgi:HEAT repeat protein